MEPFEYVMVLVSIIIGLAIAHRLRGHGPPIRLEPVYLLWVGFLFIWLVSFWWWEFKFQDLDVDWTFGLYLFIVSYAMWLFVLAVVRVPDDMEGMRDSFEYFLEGRHWFFATVLIVTGLDITDTFLKGTDWGVRPVYIAQTAVNVAACSSGFKPRAEACTWRRRLSPLASSWSTCSASSGSRVRGERVHRSSCWSTWRRVRTSSGWCSRVPAGWCSRPREKGC